MHTLYSAFPRAGRGTRRTLCLNSVALSASPDCALRDPQTRNGSCSCSEPTRPTAARWFTDEAKNTEARPTPSASADTTKATAKEPEKTEEEDLSDLDQALDKIKLEPDSKSSVDIMSEKQKSVLAGLRDVGSGRTAKFEGVRDQRTKRWYTEVKVAEVPENDSWTVLLDGRIVISKQQKAMYLPNEDVANLVATEWALQSETEPISYATMPTILAAFKAIDDYGTYFKPYLDELMTFLDTDLVCLLEPPTSRFAKRQKSLYLPVIEWFKSEEGMGMEVIPTVAFTCEHPQETMDAIQYWLEELFMAFHNMVVATKSVIASFAVWRGFLDLDTLFSIARAEEIFQAENHGEVEGSYDLKTLETQAMIGSAMMLLRATAEPPTAATFAPLLKTAGGLLAEKREKERMERLAKDIRFWEYMKKASEDGMNDASTPESTREMHRILYADAVRLLANPDQIGKPVTEEQRVQTELMMEELAIEAARQMKEKGVDLGDISRSGLRKMREKQAKMDSVSSPEAKRMIELGFDVTDEKPQEEKSGEEQTETKTSKETESNSGEGGQTKKKTTKAKKKATPAATPEKAEE